MIRPGVERRKGGEAGLRKHMGHRSQGTAPVWGNDAGVVSRQGERQESGQVNKGKLVESACRQVAWVLEGRASQ